MRRVAGAAAVFVGLLAQKFGRLGGLGFLLVALEKGWSWYLLLVPVGLTILFFGEIREWFVSEHAEEAQETERYEQPADASRKDAATSIDARTILSVFVGVFVVFAVVASRLGGVGVVFFAAREGWSWYLVFVPVGLALIFYAEIWRWFLSELEKEDDEMERYRYGRP